MINYLMMLFIFINFLFNLFNHPLILSSMLFFKTLIICLMMINLSLSSWFSYILFLIFIGGILILFMYTISLISNEKFQIFKNFSYLNFFSLMILMLIMFKLKFNINNWDLIIMENKMFEFSLNKLYNFPTNIINIFLIFYLFFMLIITVNICNLNYGPLRIK